MRSVSFLHPGTEEMASYRYRSLTPAQEIGATVNNPDADIIVFSKPMPEAFLLKAKGKVIVADFCDNHFNHKDFNWLYHGMAQIADYCVCPTEEMRKLIPHKNVTVIPDPYEMPEVSPHADGEKLLWFGHNLSLPALEPWKDLKGLTIVTGPNVTEGMVKYSEDALRVEMLKANIAIFPTVKGHEYKSPNRVINALRMGLYPVCDRHPSYTEFKNFVWQSDIPTGLKWAGEFRHELNDLVKAGQDYIREKYSPKAIGAQWKQLLESIA